MGECESTHMFASRNGESRPTSTYAMTLPFHPWNEVEICSTLACAKKRKEKKGEPGWSDHSFEQLRKEKEKNQMCVYAYLDVAIMWHLDVTVSGEVCVHVLCFTAYAWTQVRSIYGVCVRVVG